MSLPTFATVEYEGVTYQDVPCCLECGEIIWAGLRCDAHHRAWLRRFYDRFTADMERGTARAFRRGLGRRLTRAVREVHGE